MAKKKSKAAAMAANSPSYDAMIQDVQTPLGAPATNQEQRHRTLVYCVGRWSNDDVALIERVDNGNDHGWGMDRL